MRRTLLLFPILALLLACQAPPADLTEEDVSALRDVTERYVATALAGDWDAWTALSTEGAIYLVPNGPPIEGRAALREWIAGFAGMASFTATPVEIDGQAGLAYARGTYAFAMGPEAAVQMSDSGKWLTIYRKQADGSWRIARNIWNSNQPQQP